MKITHSLGSLSRGALFTAGLLFATVGFAEPGDLVGKTKEIAPTRTGTTGKAVVDSTLGFFPQINQSLKARPYTPANPSIAPGPAPTKNNLVAGGVLPNPVGFSPTAKFPGINFTGSIPPDPDIAVGPRHVVLTVNGGVAFYDKTGKVLFQQQDSNTGFWSGLGATPFIFDPKCFYDHISKRFFIVELEVDFDAKLSNLLIAVSDDDNPIGTWNKFRIDNLVKKSDTEQYWLDYPGFGYNKDSIVVTGNMFPFDAGGVFTQSLVIPKAPLFAGQAGTVTKFDMDAFTVQVAKTPDSTGSTVYGLEATNSQGNFLSVFAWTNTNTTPRLLQTQVAVPSFFFPGLSLPTKGNSRGLDNIGGRMMSAYQLGSSLLGTHTILDADNRRSVVRWYEVSVRNFPGGAATLTQSGDIKLSGGAHTAIPSIAMNKLGDISLAYSRTNSGIFPEGVYSGRKLTDTKGFMGAPRLFAPSLGVHQANRFGDYSDTEVDPDNGYTFWGVVNSFGANNLWTTDIVSWNISLPSDQIVGDKPTAIKTVQGTNTGGNVVSAGAADGQTYDVKSANVTNIGQASQSESTFKTTVPVASVQEITITSAAVQVGGASVTGTLFGYNNKTKVWDLLKSGTVGSALNTTLNTTVSGAKAREYVAANGTILIRFRGFEPVSRQRGNPNPHTVKLDKINISVARA